MKETKRTGGSADWKTLPMKDRIAYVMAVVLIASGIVMAFLAFFIDARHNINGSVLGYCGEVFATGGALMGVGLYVKNKIGEAVSSIPELIRRELGKEGGGQ